MLFVFSSSAQAQTISVEVLVINGENFPIEQFRIASADLCRGEHYHGGLVFSIDNVSLTELDPGACGFGRVDDVLRKTIQLTVAQVADFKGPSLASPAEIESAKQAEIKIPPKIGEPLAVTEGVSEEVPAGLLGVIEQNQGAIQSSLVVAAPIVVLATAPLWGYIPYLPKLIYHFFSWLIGLIRKKKKPRFIGVVYDSISKKPLGLGIVRIFETKTNKLVLTKVTDRRGRYNFLVEPGDYRLEVKKPEFVFPSSIVTSSIDGEYQHVYQTQTGISVDQTDSVIPDIPLDPQNYDKHWEIGGLFSKLWMSFQKVGSTLALPVLIIGTVFSILSIVAVPDSLLNWILAIVYLLLLVMQVFLRTPHERPWGVVYDVSTNKYLSLVAIQLIETEYNKVVKSRLSDYRGRFSFVPEPGRYVIKASKEGHRQVEKVEKAHEGRRPIIATININKPHQQISGDVPMESA